MKNLATYIGKNLLVLSEAAVVGTVSDFLLDFRTRKVAGFVVGEGSGALVFSPKKLFSEGDVLTYLNFAGTKHRFELENSRFFGLLGASAYSTDGKLLGVITDVECEEDGKVTAFGCEEGVWIDEKLLSASEGCLVFKGEKPAVLRRTRQKKLPVPEADYPVELLQDEDVAPDTEAGKVSFVAQTPETADTAEEKVEIVYTAPAQEMPAADLDDDVLFVDEGVAPLDKVETVSTAGVTIAEALDGAEVLNFPPDAGVPSRIIRDYGFLVGRRALVSIRSADRELLVAVGAVITASIVERVKHSGKLLELILNSK